jgi:hypothetical protein
VDAKTSGEDGAFLKATHVHPYFRATFGHSHRIGPLT